MAFSLYNSLSNLFSVDEGKDNKPIGWSAEPDEESDNEPVSGMFDWFELDDEVGRGRANKEKDSRNVNGFLQNAGFMEPEPKTPSGLFTADTEQALKGFQTQNALKVDGWLKPKGPTHDTMKKQIGAMAAHYVREDAAPNDWLATGLNEAAKTRARKPKPPNPEKSGWLNVDLSKVRKSMKAARELREKRENALRVRAGSFS